MKKKLTPKKLHFARCIASGMTQSDAYREAYTVRPSTTAASIHTCASRIATDVEVASRVRHLIGMRERAVAASAVTDRERVLTKLRGWMDEAEPSDSVKVRAAELLGKGVANGLSGGNRLHSFPYPTPPYAPRVADLYYIVFHSNNYQLFTLSPENANQINSLSPFLLRKRSRSPCH